MINALVSLKQVIDPYVKIRVKSCHTGIEKLGVKHCVNPFDEVALEEALRLREQGFIHKVTVVTVGLASALHQMLRRALAMGADEAILVASERPFCSINIARILKKIVLDGPFQLVLMGKQSIDGDNSQTPGMLAGLLSWPQINFTSLIKPEGEALCLTQKLDKGLKLIRIRPPAVISTELNLNKPRYISLNHLIKANSKNIDIRPIESLNLDLPIHQMVLKTQAPKKKSQAVKLHSLDELLNRLEKEHHSFSCLLN